MSILLAAIIFTFFAVFAPNSHGDRPLLLADHKEGEIQYSEFKLPIGRLQAQAEVENTLYPLFVSPYFILLYAQILDISALFLKQSFSLKNNLLSVHTSPFVFCEILQV
ncbi:MAG: hypothetical protein NDI63_07945 [Pseudobdellovibrio sp.]|nr:hypothetical protein [Pseudobdellovibrio sp.]